MMKLNKFTKYLNIFLLFLIAPFLGFLIGLYSSEPINNIEETLVIPVSAMDKSIDDINAELATTSENIAKTKEDVKQILADADKKNKEYQQQKESLDSLVKTSKEQTQKSDIVLEQTLSKLLGDPISVHQGQNSTIKVYTLNGAGYRGYMAKVRPHTSDALKLVLADDQVFNNGETTSDAAKRTGAMLAVNAGGYWKTKDGKMAPLGITVVDGEIKTFYENEKLSFVGFNTSGHLVGGKYKTEDEIKDNNILQGSSFVPTLLEDGKKTEIPADWANKKHPRTIVGNFSNGELLFIVIDGRRDGWSSGVTLEEVQDKLLSFKVKDAFNLDGGGSSTFYFDGNVLNKPSDGRERPVTSNLIILP